MLVLQAFTLTVHGDGDPAPTRMRYDAANKSVVTAYPSLHSFVHWRGR
jgi:hypothetical protein